MGSGPSKTKSKPTRVEPGWLKRKSLGDAFGLLYTTRTGIGFDQEYKPDRQPLDPIGRLTYVTDGGTDKSPDVEYTYTWPVPTEGPLQRLAPIWHCTQYTATVAYRDNGARARLSTVLPEGRAFRLAHAREKGAPITLDHLEIRTRSALNRRANNRGKSVWEKWREKHRGRDEFRTVEETVKRMVGYIKELVDTAEAPVQKEAPRRRPVKESGAASAPDDGGKRRLAQSAESAERGRAERAERERAERERAERRERIASVLDGAAKDVSILGNGLDLRKGYDTYALRMLYASRPIETKEALSGLRDMAKDRPFEVVEYLKCFVHLVDLNSFPDADDPRYVDYSRDMCDSAPLRQMFPGVMKRTAKALWELAVKSRNETLAYFHGGLMPKLA